MNRTFRSRPASLRASATTPIRLAVGLALGLGGSAAFAQGVSPELQSLKEQVEQLKSQIQQIEARQAQAGATTTPTPGAASSGAASQLTEPTARKESSAGLNFGKVKIGAVFFGDYAYYTKTGFGPQFLTQLNQDGPGNNGFNSFDVTRTYINLLYSPNDAITLRLTPNIYRQVDVSNAVGNGKNSGIASSSNGNLGFRLKYAYIDFNTLFKGAGALSKSKLTIGQTTNPLVDWEEGLNSRRYVYLTPWNYLSLSSTYSGITLHGPVEFGGREYLDYHLGVFNTASFHAIEVSEKKQFMARLTWYPFGTTADRTGLGLTAFENYGYNTKAPDAISTPLNRIAVLVHYQSPDKAYLLSGEYDLGRNAFSVGNLFSGAGPADALGLATTPTPYASFSSLSSALLGGNHTRQQGYAVFGHAKLGPTPFYLFGFYQNFQPNTRVSGDNPLDFQRIVAGVSYKYNEHLEFALDDQNLNYRNKGQVMTAAQIAPLSGKLAAANPGGIANILTDTNVIFLNVQFTY